MQCEGIIPASAKGETIDGQIVEADQPERRCEREATMLGRSMREARCDLGELHWVTVADHGYCRRHFISGRMEHFDGRVSKHPALAVES